MNKSILWLPCVCCNRVVYVPIYIQSSYIANEPKGIYALYLHNYINIAIYFNWGLPLFHSCMYMLGHIFKFFVMYIHALKYNHCFWFPIIHIPVSVLGEKVLYYQLRLAVLACGYYAFKCFWVGFCLLCSNYAPQINYCIMSCKFNISFHLH